MASDEENFEDEMENGNNELISLDEDNPEMHNLTRDQYDSVKHFQEIAGGLDFDESKHALESHNWDLETAVNVFMGLPSTPAASNTVNEPAYSVPGGSTSNGPFHSFNGQQDASTVVSDIETQIIHRNRHTYSHPTLSPRVPEVDISYRQTVIRNTGDRGRLNWFQWSIRVITFPFKLTYNTFVDVVVFLLSFVRPDPRRQVTDPEGDVRRFIEHFEEQYGNQHPAFIHGTYSHALQIAKRDLKFLLVYLHGDSHEDTPQFCRETLCSPLVITFLEENMLFWACNINSPEGYRVSQSLREHSYPFLSVIVLQRSRLTQVARIEGLLTDNELVNQLRKIIRDNELSLNEARQERQERELTQRLRLEQDEAYQNSLREDRLKEERRLEAERKKKEAEEVERQAQLEIERQREERRNKICLLKENLPPEPDGSADLIRLVIKLPNGKRLERKFYPTDSVKLLYYFVLCNESAPENFELLRNFPSRVLPCEPEDVEWTGEPIVREPRAEINDPPSFQDLGITKSEMVLVRDVDA